MPKYTYACVECKETYEVFHGMQDDLQVCSLCGSKNIEKKPSMFSLNKDNSDDKQVGDLVKQAIKNFREELNEQKKDLKKDYVGKDK